MGLDADLSKYKTSSISKEDRENYVEWRTESYYKLEEDNEKWNEFEKEVFYTEDRLLNNIILDSIKETTGDTFSEEGASLFNIDTFKTINGKLNNAIHLGGYKDYKMLDKDYYIKELQNLKDILDNERFDLQSNEYTYLYHATY